jgi:hypothetical protein
VGTRSELGTVTGPTFMKGGLSRVLPMLLLSDDGMSRKREIRIPIKVLFMVLSTQLCEPTMRQ